MTPDSSEIAELRAELAQTQARFEEISTSKSWRYTAPLRAAVKRLRDRGSSAPAPAAPAAPAAPPAPPQAPAAQAAPAAPTAPEPSPPTPPATEEAPQFAPLVDRMAVMKPSGLGASLSALTPQERTERLNAMPRAELLEIAKGLNWIHEIDLGDGFVTQGIWGPQPGMEQALNAIDFTGKRVLDIGCWDGGYTFAAERLGASLVYGTDLITERGFMEQPTFEVARALLGSSALYRSDMSVYDLDKLEVRDFDVVIFAGVYYHLKHPILALEAIRRVMKLGGTLLIEGAVDDTPGCFATFYHYEDCLGDPSNWWVPTVASLSSGWPARISESTASSSAGVTRTTLATRWWRRP